VSVQTVRHTFQKTIFSFLTAALFLWASAGVAPAQSSRGTVTGLTTDLSKAVVSKAKVELTNEQTKVVRSTTTNDSGEYRFDAVDPGTYTIKLTAAGFRAVQVAPFEVTASQVKSIDAQFEIGSVSSTVDVSSEATLIQTEAPVRGGTISASSAVNLPVAGENPVALSLTLPGVSTNRYSFGVNTFSVNGARGRSNNFLIDGTENNDISVTGQAFQITNPDAIQEVSTQTANFDSEYGRAGGAVVNVITKSGTNQFHGSLRYLLESTISDAPTNLQKLDPNVLLRGHPLPGTDQYFSGTVGGPIWKDKTFFFSAYQEERQVSTSQVGLTTLSALGRATLLSAYPTGVNPRADLLLAITASAVANSQFSNVALSNGQNVQVGTYQRAYANKFHDRQLQERIDHSFSNSDQLSVRYLFDSSGSPTGGTTGFLGFDTSFANEVNSGLLNETHTFSAQATNEFRLGYNRIYYFFPFDATGTLAPTTPNITIAGFTTLGVPSNLPQGRIANNYELQDTFSDTVGRHSLRFGTSLLDQRSKQAAPFNVRGTLSYQASGSFSGLQNYLDDFGGSGGSAGHDFGSASYYPKLFRQAYFGQDRWRVNDSLTISMGLRWEFFGNPINNLRTPAYTGLFNIDPVTFTGPWSQPNKVKSDLNNFSPNLGIAYSPASSGPIPWLIGDKKTVFRSGFSMGYDSFFNNIASNAVASAPNNVSVSTASSVTTATPRGLASLSQQIPVVAPALSPTASQTLVIGNLLNPYYMRWSGGFQRDLPGHVVLDVSYVGSRGVKLFANEDLNPLVPASLRIYPTGYTAASFPASRLQARLDPLQGSRLIRTNGGSSNYQSFQVSANRRFSNQLSFTLSYTRSKFIDNTSDIFGSAGNGLPQNTALPSIYGGLTADRSVSNYDRPNRFTMTSVYELPFFHQQRSIVGHVLGGWQLAGVYSLESGAPINITNGFDADGLGGNYDRPLYNPSGAVGVRAVPSATSPTGYINPDAANAPIAASAAEYIVLPACSATVVCPGGNLGRFTARTPRQNNLDLDLTKIVKISERFNVQFRAEFYNAFNHRQYGIASVSPFDSGSTTIAASAGTSLAGRFLNPGYADGGARVIRYQIKFVF
jgi:hypothetical protein